MFGVFADCLDNSSLSTIGTNISSPINIEAPTMNTSLSTAPLLPFLGGAVGVEEASTMSTVLSFILDGGGYKCVGHLEV